MKCPKCQYEREKKDLYKSADECPSCGIIYSKYQAYLERTTNPIKEEEIEDEEYEIPTSKFEIIKAAFLFCPESTDSIAYYARVLCLGVFALWGCYFIYRGIDPYFLMNSFMHNINLVFHEAGHMFFIPFGRFMTILGGSLFQVLLPFSLMLAFVIKQKENFGASIMLWWTGQSLIDVSPYIDDAIDRALPLIGGMGEEAHDWGNLLTMTNMLNHTHSIANITFFFGSVFIITSVVWGGYYLKVMKTRIR